VGQQTKHCYYLTKASAARPDSVYRGTHRQGIVRQLINMYSVYTSFDRQLVVHVVELSENLYITAKLIITSSLRIVDSIRQLLYARLLNQYRCIANKLRYDNFTRTIMLI